MATRPARTLTAQDMRDRIGTVGLSDWLVVDQAMIDRFAQATGDRQFIHVDPAAAAATPFGGTIAHGFLLLSLMPLLFDRTPDLPRPEGAAIAVNYGGNRVRFLTPVRAGSRVRARFTLLSFIEKRPGQFQQVIEYRLDIDGEPRPALIAEWITLLACPT